MNAPLVALMEQERCALAAVGISRKTQRAALHRPGGSIAFVAAARLVLAVAADPHDPERRLLAPLKSNLCRPAPVLAYRIGDHGLTGEADPVSNLDADALLRPSMPIDREQQTDAETVIRELLKDEPSWPLDAGDALDAGRAHGVPRPHDAMDGKAPRHRHPPRRVWSRGQVALAPADHCRNRRRHSCLPQRRCVYGAYAGTRRHSRKTRHRRNEKFFPARARRRSTTMPSASDYVLLKGGLAVPVAPVLLLLDLEARGFTVTRDRDDVVIRPRGKLTDDDRAAAVEAARARAGRLPGTGSRVRDVNTRHGRTT